MYISPTKAQETSQKKKQKECRSRGRWKVVWKSDFQERHSYLTVAVISSTQSAQDWVYNHPMTVRRGAHEAPPHPQNLYASDG